jgi:surface antigen
VSRYKGLLCLVGALNGTLPAFADSGGNAAADDNDRAAINRTIQRALDRGPSGKQLTWENRDNGHSGWVVPEPTLRTPKGEKCRDFTQVLVVAGETTSKSGLGCRQPDGSWKIYGMDL